jgi:hypothetical protein
MTPKYLEAFRRAVRKTGNREISEVSEKRGTGEGLNSLNTLNSPPEPSQNCCAVCDATSDLWHVATAAGPVLVHQECVRFLTRPEAAEPIAAYRAVSTDPDGTACKVEIVELPQAGRYRKVFGVLQLKPPDLVDVTRWRQCVTDGSKFLAVWGESAESLGWSSADLFALAPVPAKPHPSYSRLSRYDAVGLIWLLQGRPVVALTEATATIRNPATGNLTTYRPLQQTGVARRLNPLATGQPQLWND